MRTRVLCVAALTLAGCAARSPTIDREPGAPPRPETFWTPSSSVQTQNARAADSTRPPPSDLGRLTLSGVVDFALRNNPATRISWTEARAAVDQYGASRGALYPLLSANIGATRSQSATNSGAAERTQYGPSVSLSYLVFDFGGRNGAVESARQTAIAANFSHNVSVQNTILQAESAAFDYLATRALRDAQRAAVAEAAASLGAAEERHRVGLATIADVLQARTARAQAELNLESLEGQLLVTRGGLAVAMGVPPTTTIELPDVVAPDSATVRSVAQSVDSIISLAVRNRPDLAAARAEGARAAAEVHVARSDGRPSLGFIAGGGYNGSNVSNFSGRTYSLGFGVSIPLFSGFANTYAVRAATERLGTANARSELTRRQVELDVFSSYYALQTATDRVRTSAELLSSADESERVALGRYTEGVGSIVDVLIAQSTLASARAQAVDARWQWRTTLAVLAHDAGVLDIHGEPLVPLSTTTGREP